MSDVTMRILILTYRFPSHTTTADRNTVYHLARHLHTAGHRVYLLAFASDATEACQTELLEPYCEEIQVIVRTKIRSVVSAVRGIASREPLQMWYYRHGAMQRAVHAMVRQNSIDIAYAYHLRMAQYLTSLDIATVAALQPAQILHFGRRAHLIRNPAMRWLYRVEHARLDGYERSVARKLDAALLISNTDLTAIDPHGELSNVFLNPHGVDTDVFRPNPEIDREPNTLIFTGMMGIDTNADAITHFYRQTYPLIRQEVPGVRLWIVGRDPLRSVRRLAQDDSVLVTGFVPDLRDYLWRATIAINPLRIGAGMQNKLLEAMACGTPVVATEVANEGIQAPPDAIAVVSDDPALFAQRIVDLLLDGCRRKELAERGRVFVADTWSWEAHFRPLLRIMSELASTRREAGLTNRNHVSRTPLDTQS